MMTPRESIPTVDCDGSWSACGGGRRRPLGADGSSGLCRGEPVVALDAYQASE